MYSYVSSEDMKNKLQDSFYKNLEMLDEKVNEKLEELMEKTNNLKETPKYSDFKAIENFFPAIDQVLEAAHDVMMKNTYRSMLNSMYIKLLQINFK